MRIVLFGRNGQLGQALNASLAPLAEVCASDQEDLDLANVDQIRSWLDEVQPDAIVNAAAYTDVDRAEAEPDLAYAVNATAPGMMAEYSSRSGSLLIHYSTDYVFDGEKGIPYTEEDPAHPVNTYGQTKLAGEQAIQKKAGSYLILRTSWLYGMGPNAFPTKVLAWARKQQSVRVVADQIGSPTWCRMLAGMTAAVLSQKHHHDLEWLAGKSGLYHVAGKGAVSRFEWAERILALDPHPEEQILQELLPARTEAFPTPAKRPKFSALDCSRFEATFGLSLSPWEESLMDAMKERTRW